MSELSFRFYAELNDFLPVALRHRQFNRHLNRRTSVKDMIESLGVPHTELEAIIVNGVSVDFHYILQDNDQISVYPAFSSIDISNLLKLRPSLPEKNRFVLDCHLGRLAKYLRQLGFDTLYKNDYDDEELASISATEQRILLTRDRALLKRSIIDHAYYVREVIPGKQLDEVLNRFSLAKQIKPFGLCTHCNGRIVAVRKSDIIDKLEPKTRAYYDNFYQCTDCKQIYWEGSHYEKLQKLFNEISMKTVH